MAVGAFLFAVIDLLLVFIWAMTSRGYFWPGWVIVVLLGLTVAHVTTTRCVRGRRRDVLASDRIRIDRISMGRAGLEMVAGILLGLAVSLWGIWCMTWATGGGVNGLWPVWPSTAFAFVLAVQAVFAFSLREGDPAARLEQLTVSRAGVVEAQELELRRIERDLHDGAQARLVALGMQLGLTEQQLDKSPEKVRELLAEARATNREALRELRDLARGIYPPVLADRGLVPAIESLVASSPLHVLVEADPGNRLPAAIEGALYFTVSEALANAGKHADAQRVTIVVRRGDRDVVATVSDDGRGGADAAGSGLVGIRQRLEALDGRLDVTSPVGGPTTIRAELPCERS
ncbi:MAG: nreB, pSRTUE45c [Thermoleophilia bacterium]|nr:nreB, pSRTUE45c [Thermoleophilia bacterium]